MQELRADRQVCRLVLLQTIEEIQLEAAVGGQHVISGFGDISIRIPRGDFCGEANDSGTGIAGKKFDGELVEAAFVMIERLTDGGDETVEDRKLLAGVGLQILEGLFYFGLGLGDSCGRKERPDRATGGATSGECQNAAKRRKVRRHKAYLWERVMVALPAVLRGAIRAALREFRCRANEV